MRKAADHLGRNDPKLKTVIKQAGLCKIEPHKDYYRQLVRSVIGQQLSVKAAATIFERFKALFSSDFPSPDQILVTTHDKLRSVGLSQAKASYVRDLAQHIVDGQLELEKFDSMSNDEIIAELTAVKGIGEWTAHMFLMFAMARLDVLAVGDLGIKIGVKKLYGLKQLPTAEQIRELADKNNWHPYETVACWYVWHSKDNA